MKIELSLIQKTDGSLFLESGGRTRAVRTVSQAARILRRTRRQVYRYIETGLLKPEAKLLGEWLLDAAEVERTAERPLAVQPLPKKLKSLFPEYNISNINAGRDKTLVISRVLENGGSAEIKWAFKRYNRRELAKFIEEDGARLLGSRSLRLWSLVLGARPNPIPAWRNDGIWRK
ncbi:MAG: helix-turn-helix domain-containing protein [Elusimicrobia bacterium]|nr:helix-turn-helix domain-containing protein [Elusimicrobiota bacterium]